MDISRGIAVRVVAPRPLEVGVTKHDAEPELRAVAVEHASIDKRRAHLPRMHRAMLAGEATGNHTRTVDEVALANGQKIHRLSGRVRRHETTSRVNCAARSTP